MSENPTRVYQKGILTVEWWADRCIHCEHCVASLPAVFNPEARPWINLDGAHVSQIEVVCNVCPSKAIVAEVS